MADSQALVVGGGIAAVPAFDATDETLGRGVFVSADTPPAVRAAVSFGQDSTGFFWAQSGLTSVQSVANQQSAVLIGRALVNFATLFTGNIAPVIIGKAAGANITGGTVLSDGVAIGAGAITDALAICIGATVMVNCNAGADMPVLIGCRAVTGTAVSSGVFIGEGGGGVPNINANGGIYLQGHTNGVVVADGVAIFGIIEGDRSVVVGRLARASGARGVALGEGARAPGSGTLYNEAIAIGSQANATATGAAGNRRSIAIGVSAVATCDNATANAIAIGTSASATAAGATGAAVALGPGAIAINGQCVIGAAGFPMELFVQSGAIHLDTTGADAVLGTGTLDAAGTVTIATTRAAAGMFILVTPTVTLTGPLFTQNIVAATSFDVTSAAGVADAGVTFDWVLLKTA
jgi:hypothetical protein